MIINLMKSAVEINIRLVQAGVGFTPGELWLLGIMGPPWRLDTRIYPKWVRIVLPSFPTHTDSLKSSLVTLAFRKLL